MDARHADQLGELARDAALERADFLVQATDQLRRFLDANEERIREAGGLVLIDEEPDYLSVEPDLTFRSRTRFQDEETGEWRSETEEIESAAELVELYNPSDIYAAFAEAARVAAGLAPEPTAADDVLAAAHVAAADTVSVGGEGYAAAADDWAARQEALGAPETEEEAAQRLYDLALVFQERSQAAEAQLLEDFASSAAMLTDKLGDFVIIEDDDERLTIKADGSLDGEVQPDDEEGEWRRLSTPDDIVAFYDPTDVFGDLADALADAFPSVAPEEGDEDEEEPGEDEADEDEGPDEDGDGESDRA